MDGRQTMDGATVAVRCEGLPDDVVERLQRKVMEQARELSALRKSEAAAQAERKREDRERDLAEEEVCWCKFFESCSLCFGKA